MREYKLFSQEEAVKAGLEEENLYRNEGYIHHLVEVIDGKPIRVLGSDGGEPEDQTFGRDWKWVVEEINKAYQAGYECGREVQYKAEKTLRIK